MAKLGHHLHYDRCHQVVILTRPHDLDAARELGNQVLTEDTGYSFVGPFKTEEERRRTLDLINRRSEQLACAAKRGLAYKLPPLESLLPIGFPSLQTWPRKRGIYAGSTESFWHLR